MRSLRGRTAQIRIVDNCVAGDGYSRIHQIAQSDSPRGGLLSNPQIVVRANRNVGHVNDQSVRLSTIDRNLIEVQAKIEPGTANTFGLNVRVSPDRTRMVSIICDRQRLSIAGETLPATPMEGETTLRLHVFLDQHCMGVFVNDSLVYTESIVGSPATDTAVELSAEGGDMPVKQVDV